LRAELQRRRGGHLEILRAARIEQGRRVQPEAAGVGAGREGDRADRVELVQRLVDLGRRQLGLA